MRGFARHHPKRRYTPEDFKRDLEARLPDENSNLPGPPVSGRPHRALRAWGQLRHVLAGPSACPLAAFTSVRRVSPGAPPKLTPQDKLAIRDVVAGWTGKRANLWRSLATRYRVSVPTIMRAMK